MNLFRTLPGWSRSFVYTLVILGLWALPTTAQEASHPTYLLYVDGLACPFCAYGLEKSLTTIAGINSIETDIETGAVIVTMVGGATLHLMAATQAVENAGFVLRDFRQIEAMGQSRPEG